MVTKAENLHFAKLSSLMCIGQGCIASKKRAEHNQSLGGIEFFIAQLSARKQAKRLFQSGRRHSGNPRQGSRLFPQRYYLHKSSCIQRPKICRRAICLISQLRHTESKKNIQLLQWPVDLCILKTLLGESFPIFCSRIFIGGEQELSGSLFSLGLMLIYPFQASMQSQSEKQEAANHIRISIFGNCFALSTLNALVSILPTLHRAKAVNTRILTRLKMYCYLVQCGISS